MADIHCAAPGEIVEIYRKVRECVEMAERDGLVKDGVVKVYVLETVPAQQVTIKFEFQ